MLQQTRHLFKTSQHLSKPKASEVLTLYIKQCNEPPWTSYFVKVRNQLINYTFEAISIIDVLLITYTVRRCS